MQLMDDKALFENIERYLNNLSNRTGEILTEYDWREVCGLLNEVQQRTGTLPPQVPTQHDNWLDWHDL